MEKRTYLLMGIGLLSTLVLIWGLNTVYASDIDTDGDKLFDIDETYTYGTDPFDWDTDDDTCSDGVEVENGTDPLDPSDYPAIIECCGGGPGM